MDILAFAREMASKVLSVGSRKVTQQYLEIPVGEGYYALRQNVANVSKKGYTKLVKADRSYSALTQEQSLLVTKPIVGMRYPEKRRGRRALFKKES